MKVGTTLIHISCTDRVLQRSLCVCLILLWSDIPQRQMLAGTQMAIHASSKFYHGDDSLYHAAGSHGWDLLVICTTIAGGRKHDATCDKQVLPIGSGITLNTSEPGTSEVTST